MKQVVAELPRIVATLARLKMKRLLRRLGAGGHDDYVAVGRRTYGVIPERTVIRASAEYPVEIGSFCSIAPGVIIVAHAEHPTDLPSTFPFRSLMFDGMESWMGLHNRDAVAQGPVRIGHDVWIGMNAIILSGTTIGTGAVIGAGAVVHKDVAPYEIVAGNPARHLRFRFAADIIERLLATRWWELSDREIEDLGDKFYSRDIEAFIAAANEHRRGAQQA
jgi:acetyltransferase-like isoleucine patch superfamily enzyme